MIPVFSENANFHFLKSEKLQRGECKIVTFCTAVPLRVESANVSRDRVCITFWQTQPVFVLELFLFSYIRELLCGLIK